MGDQPEKPDNDSETTQRFTFHFIKSNHFRVIHGDGAWGGITPSGSLAMVFYSERMPIPQRIDHEITPVGTLGAPTNVESKRGVVREMEVEVVVNLEAAKGISNWLNAQIESLEKAHSDEQEPAREPNEPSVG